MSKEEKKPATEAVAPAKKTKAPAKAPAARKPALVYVGPGMPARGLVPFMIFRGGVLPAYVVDLQGECPAMRSLFVEASKLAVVRAQLAGSEMSAIKTQYDAASAYFANKGGAN